MQTKMTPISTTVIEDLKDEGAVNIKHNIVRCKKEEPLTIY